MDIQINKINQNILEIHNALTGKDDSVNDIVLRQINKKFDETLLHESGISGKVASGRTIDSKNYYSLLDLGE